MRPGVGLRRTPDKGSPGNRPSRKPAETKSGEERGEIRPTAAGPSTCDRTSTQQPYLGRQVLQQVGRVEEHRNYKLAHKQTLSQDQQRLP